MTNPDNFNRYAYCLNNPLKYTDPSGYAYHPGTHESPKAPESTRDYGSHEFWNGYYGYDIESGHQSGHPPLSAEIKQRNGTTGVVEYINFQLYINGQPASIGETKAYLKEHGYDLDKASNKILNFQEASASEKILHVINSIKDANENGQKHIDMRQIFSNFPVQGSGFDLTGSVKIENKDMPIHLNIAVYKNMQIGIFPSRMLQVGPFDAKSVDGIIKNGYWDVMEYNRAGGTIQMMMIQTTNFDFYRLYNYLYK